MFTIDFETHFYTKKCFDYLSDSKSIPTISPGEEKGSYNIEYAPSVSLYHPKKMMTELFTIGDERIKWMDAAKINIQVLSLTTPSGTESFPKDVKNGIHLARDANDELFNAISKNKDRLRGFAALCPFDPAEAAKELERAILKLNFVGWLTHSNYGKDDYLDDQKYWPILEAAESLNVPIYLHPTVPLMPEFAKYGFALAGSAMGFEFDTALCAMRMILAGVFDQYPRLKIMMGHLGETLPFLMERLDHLYRIKGFEKYRPNIKKHPSDYLKENFYITTSGRFFTPTLRYVVDVMGENHVLFATDFPYESMDESVNFILNSGLPQATIKKIFSKNALDLGFITNVYEM